VKFYDKEGILLDISLDNIKDGRRDILMKNRGCPWF
jgi:hypothetical protein